MEICVQKALESSCWDTKQLGVNAAKVEVLKWLLMMNEEPSAMAVMHIHEGSVMCSLDG